MTNQLKTTQEVIESLQIEQEKSNKQREKMGLERIRSIFLGRKFFYFFYIKIK
jgi:hypothetical protein